MKKTVLVVLAMALLPACLFAVDGVVLINQSTVMAAGASRIISQPGSYKLTGNLIVPNEASGISITANNVTLDLNGFSMTGAQRVASVSNIRTALIHSDAVIGTTLRNGTLAGNHPDRLIDFSLATGSVFEDLTIYDNFGPGNDSRLGTNVIVRRVNATTGLILVRCPALVTDSLAAQFQLDPAFSPLSSCSFGPFSGAVL